MRSAEYLFGGGIDSCLGRHKQTIFTMSGRAKSSLATAPVVTCMKTLLMVFNFIFWVTGIVILAIGIWTKVDLYRYLELSTIYQPQASYVLIGVGAIIVLVGSLGCCCTAKGHAFLLYMYAGFLVLVFVVELSAGAALLVYRKKLEAGFKEGLSNALKTYGDPKEAEISDALDMLQSKLHCCGVESYIDWYTKPWAQQNHTVPKSCCHVSLATCHNTNLPVDKNTTDLDINTQGCHKLVVDFINGNMGPIGGVALGISFFQVLGAILACCLAKSINKAKYEQVQ